MVNRVSNLFGDYLPDLQDRDNPGTTRTQNMIPHAGSYSSFSDMVKQVDAITGYCLGAASLESLLGGVHAYAGDATKLYELSAGVYGDKSRTIVGGSSADGYNIADTSKWEFIRTPSQTMENHVIAANGEDFLQVQTGFTGIFADIVNTGVDPTPKLAHIAPVRGFILGGNDPTNTALLKWCSLNEYDQWDPGVRAAGEQTLPRGGQITKVVGGEYGVVFCDHAIFRVNYLGDDEIVFQIDEVEPIRGTTASGSVAQYGYHIYFIDTDGFYVFDGASAIQIGSNKVNHEFIQDYDSAQAAKVVSAVDLENNLILWAYPGEGHTDGLPNRIMAFDITTGRFAGPILLEVEQLAYSAFDTEAMLDLVVSPTYPWPVLGAGPDIDLDQVPAYLEDPIFAGGSPVLGAFDSSHQNSIFTGDALEAIIETGEYNLNPQGRAFVSAVRALVDNDANGSDIGIFISIGTRNKPYGAIEWSAEQTPHARTDLASFREDAMYHRFRVRITGDFHHLFGGDVEFENSGYR